MKPLYEQYRPQSIFDLCGQEKVKKQVEFFISTNRVGGNAFFITGKYRNDWRVKP